MIDFWSMFKVRSMYIFLNSLYPCRVERSGVIQKLPESIHPFNISTPEEKYFLMVSHQECARIRD